LLQQGYSRKGIIEAFKAEESPVKIGVKSNQVIIIIGVVLALFIGALAGYQYGLLSIIIPESITTSTIITTTSTTTTVPTTTTTTTTTTTEPETFVEELERVDYKEDPISTIGEFPEDLIQNNIFKGIIVVGSGGDDSSLIASNIISSTLVITGISSAGGRVETGSSFIDTEITNYDLRTKNIISVGSPCVNRVTAIIMGVPEETCDDYNLIGQNKGIIKLYEYQGNSHYIVAGWRAEDTMKAAEVFLDYQNFDLSDSFFEIE